MKTWYCAVCDEHKEMIDIFVNNVQCTYDYLFDKDELINTWLQLHYDCTMRLIHHDQDFDYCYNNGYTKVRK